MPQRIDIGRLLFCLGLALVAVTAASACTFDVSVGDSDLDQTDLDEDGFGDGDGGGESIDSCVVRAEVGDPDQDGGGGDVVEYEVCYVGDFTSGRIRASGLQPGSELKVVDSSGQTIVMEVADNGESVPPGAGVDVDIAFPQGTDEITITGTWFDGEEIDFSVVG